MTREQARDAMEFLLTEEAAPAQISAFITAMRFKGTEKAEFLGFLDAIYAHSIQINPKVQGLLNSNGPYDGRKKSILLTPGAAIVVAAAGVPIVLHSSSDLPPKYGITTAQVLEYLGIPALLEPEDVELQIEQKGFGFLHASRFLAIYEKFRPIRQLLGYRSFIHTCEVILNPAGAKNIVFGAAHDHFMLKLSEVLIERGAENIFAVAGIDGSDEAPLAEVEVVEYRNGQSRTMKIRPEDYGLKRQERMPCLNARETALAIERTLNRQDDTYRDSIVFNSAIRLYTAGKVESIQAGVKLAADTIESGRAATRLAELRS